MTRVISGRTVIARTGERWERWARAGGRSTAFQALLAFALLAPLSGCSSEPGGAARGPTAAPEVGSPVPPYTARALDGDDFDLAALRGRVVLLNVWATWCAPCVREMPKLEALYSDLAEEGLTVLGASIDRGAAAEEVRKFVESNGITFPILLDPDGLVETRFRTLGVPESFLIDRGGILRRRWIGEFDPGAEEVRREVAALLAEEVG